MLLHRFCSGLQHGRFARSGGSLDNDELVCSGDCFGGELLFFRQGKPVALALHGAVVAGNESAGNECVGELLVCGEHLGAGVVAYPVDVHAFVEEAHAMFEHVPQRCEPQLFHTFAAD